MKISGLLKKLEQFAPWEYSLDWDNSGLQIGSKEISLKKIGLALTPTEETVKKAIEQNCNLLLTHHPLIFKSIKSIDTTQPLGRTISLSLKNDLTIYTMHTNFDSLSSGLNYQIAKDLGLENINILSVTKRIKIVKLTVYIPDFYAKNLASFLEERNNLSERIILNSSVEYREGANSICFTTIQINLPENKVSDFLVQLKEKIPMEILDYETQTLENKTTDVGIGTIGEFLEPNLLESVISKVKDNLNLKQLIFTGNLHAKINRVAICTGSGSSFINLAHKRGADLLITGDIKYHEATDAKELGLNLIDAGHHGTEITFVSFMKKYLDELLSSENVEIVEIIEENPLCFA